MVEKAQHITEKRWSIHGATALVTGGSKGIGKAIVEELARLGAKVHTCARKEAELDNALQNWQQNLKLDVTASVCDVSSPAERWRLVVTVSSLFQGKLNILLFISANCHPLLKASGAGSIVFISSVAGLVAIPISTLKSH